MPRNIRLLVIGLAVSLTASCHLPAPGSPKNLRGASSAGTTVLPNRASPLPTTPSGLASALPNAVTSASPGPGTVKGSNAVSGGTLIGLVHFPPQLFTDHGGSLISDNGGGLIAGVGSDLVSNNGGGLTAQVHLIPDPGSGLVSNNGSGLVSNNGGGLVSNNGGGLVAARAFGLFGTMPSPATVGLAQDLVVGAYVQLVDAAGVPVKDAKGVPLSTQTDATGHYRFNTTLPATNLVVLVDLNKLGKLNAVVPRDNKPGTAADLDLISSMTTGYILDQYVNSQANRVATLDRLPGGVESETRAAALAGFQRSALGLPASLATNDIVTEVNNLRSLDTQFSNQMEIVKQLLVVGGSASLTDGAALSAQFSGPNGLAYDAAGNLYIADTFDQLVRKLSPGGQITTLAGSGKPGFADGTGVAATFSYPQGLAVDPAGNVYVADTNSHEIRKISPVGVVTTVAGQTYKGQANGQGTEALFNRPRGLAFDGMGNLYIADTDNNMIRVMTPDATVSTLVDGNGGLSNPTGVALVGQMLYISDTRHNVVSRIDLTDASHTVNTLAGTGQSGASDGPGTTATFNGPGALVAYKQTLFVSDAGGTALRRIDLMDPAHPVTTWQAGHASRGGSPGREGGLAIDPTGTTLVLANTPGNTIGSVALADPTHALVALAGSGSGPSLTGTGTGALLDGPNGVVAEPDGTLYVTDTNNNAIRRITPDGTLSPIAGGTAGRADGPGAQAQFSLPTGLALDAKGKTLYVTDSANHSVRRIDLSVPTYPVTTVALVDASGKDASGQLRKVHGIAVGPDGTIFVSDYDGNRIFKIDPAGVLTAIAGQAPPASPGYADGDGAAASFYSPWGLALDASGNNLYVADYRNFVIRKIETNLPNYPVTTLGGATPGSGSPFSHPKGVAVDGAGNVFVLDTNHEQVGEIDTLGNVTFPVARTTPDSFAKPAGIAIDAAGNVYVADTDNNQVRNVGKLAVPRP